VGKVYPDGTRAVEGLDLQVDDGEFVVLVGPSGCGKTTALRMVAGLEEITEGQIRIGRRVVNGLGPRERDIAMVFQNYALYPHMDVYRNMAFGLTTRKVPKQEARARVEAIARVLGLHALMRRKPAQLSGGQRQRVAMGRAIVREPQVFLMDEPLSNLDAKLRVQMRAQIARIQRAIEATTIYVTHDQVEAMTMGNRVAVMRGGVLQQVDEPQRIYEHPANLFVASFIGSPPMNLVEATVEPEAGALRLQVGSEELTVPEAPALAGYRGRTIALGIRPEALADAALDPSCPPERRLRGSVRLTEALGPALLVHVEIAAKPVVRDEVLEGGEADAVVAQEMRTDAEEHRTVLVCSFDPSSTVRPDDVAELAVDVRRLHFFDLETGEALDGR
jgi:multiple sugar transport system ATP-binding protein